MRKVSTHYINDLIDIDSFNNQFDYGIYKIYNTVNSKIYIGSVMKGKVKTKGHFRSRWLYHLSKLSTKTHNNPKLQNFVNKHGVETLRFTVVDGIKQFKSKDLQDIKLLDLYQSSFTLRLRWHSEQEYSREQIDAEVVKLKEFLIKELSVAFRV